MHTDCMDIKLEQDPTNSTIFKLYTGVSWKNEQQVLYDDHQLLIFNHPNDTSLAAMSTPEQLVAEP